LAAAEQLGMKGRRSQSTVTDDETVRLRQQLGLTPRPAQVTVGAERVVAERMVTQREMGVDRLVTAREQTTETRLQANVIRRRTAREVVKREELPGVPDGDMQAVPPGLDFDDTIPPPFDVPPSLDMPPPLDVVAAPPASAEPVEAARIVAAPAASPEPAVVEPTPVVAAPPPAPAPRPAAPAKTGPTVVVRSAPPSNAPPPPPPLPGFEVPQGPKVLGRIDLRKTVAPPGAAPWRPPSPGGAAQPAAEPGTAAGDAARKKKGKKVIQKDELGTMAERDFGGRGRRPMKKRAQPGKEVRKTEITRPGASKRVIRISEVISVGDLARAIGVKASEVLKKLIDMG